MMARGPFALPPGAQLDSDIAYGELPSQRLDVYRPASAAGAPLMLMVHGGGWQRGDKGLHRVIRNKVAHWVALGWVVVSVNYRLLPDADPLEQADDVARALAFVQRSARLWGADPEQLVLVGHSSGAHLVSLLTADPAISAGQGASPWRASVALDGAAFDVVQMMQGPHFGLHDRAFTQDPAFWRRASPLHRLAGPPAAPLLAVCSSGRDDVCRQAEAFAAQANALGGRVEVLPVDLAHGEINDQLGRPGAYTDSVERFLFSVGLPRPPATG